MHYYEKLTVWQKSMDLVEAIYHACEKFPKTEQFGLVSQMRRVAISIPSNIAEGSNRGSKKHFKQFLLIAFGSGAELETQIKLSSRLGYLENTEKLDEQLLEVMKMLRSLIAKQESQLNPSS